MAEHKLMTPAECDCPGTPYCPICDGGLAYCMVCKKAEAELDDWPECPGEPGGEAFDAQEEKLKRAGIPT